MNAVEARKGNPDTSGLATNADRPAGLDAARDLYVLTFITDKGSLMRLDRWLAELTPEKRARMQRRISPMPL